MSKRTRTSLDPQAIQFPEPVRRRTLSGNSTDRRIRRECLDRVSSDLHRSRSRFQAIGSGYRSRLCRISSHLIDTCSTQYKVLGFDISEKCIKEISEEYRERETVRFTTSRREFCRCGDDETASWAVGSDKTSRRWHVSRVKTPKP
jgi:hypothetical protein